MSRLPFLLLMLLVMVGCTLTTPGTPPTPTPSLPTVEFRFPQNNSPVYEGTDLTIELLAQDRVQGIDRVELFIDGAETPHQSAGPVDGGAVEVFTVNMNWLAQGIGRHLLTAIAYRADGLQSDETTIVIEVIPREDAAQTAPADIPATPDTP